ncbi:uncharacterized protein LOC121415657 [Lytechinus variegatus]|uniref:uncharacterized protein LOC121415657 n=1 Tax=Lytechinus variegatus TaxID=7654 RepID=UPI001BB0EDEA|nr:uncharacterized protein LOC121415657 [Lytechinus variegatus]
MGLQNYFRGNISGYVMRISSLFLLLVASSSTEVISDVRLDGGLWKGIPTVNLENKTNLQICANETYWCADAADAICQYFGFEGHMLIKLTEVPTEPESDEEYALCMVDRNITDSRLQLACQLTTACENLPTISCLLPGYEGCYNRTDDAPFFSDGETQDLGEQSLDIQTCASACSDSPYLGLTKGQECICGSTLGDRSLVGDCDLGCEGDDLQFCGADDAISVYSANVIGRCDGERVELMPGQPHYITSPKFPDDYEADVNCTWVLGIDVDISHDLEIILTYDFADDNETRYLQISSASDVLELSLQGSNGAEVLEKNPYNALQDNITVSFTPPESGTGFVMKISLTPSPVYTTAPTVAMTTSKATRNADMDKLAMSAVVGVIFVVFLLI